MIIHVYRYWSHTRWMHGYCHVASDTHPNINHSILCLTLISVNLLLELCPTLLYKLGILHPTLGGYHDASGYICGGGVLPGPTTVPWNPQLHPINAKKKTGPHRSTPHCLASAIPPGRVRVTGFLGKLSGQVTDIDLEMDSSVIHHASMADCYYVWEIIAMCRTDNTAVLWWQQNGSATSTSQPAHLLQLQALYQQFHWYILHWNSLIGVDNRISDLPYLSLYLTDTALLAHMDNNYPQRLSWQLWTPPSAIVSEIYFALQRTTLPRASPLVELPLLTGNGKSGPCSTWKFPSTP